jgi:hypothetical protein
MDFSDPPPDPSVAPLEIVANDQGVGRCALNRHEIGAGMHEVLVVTGGLDAAVVVRDPSGLVVFEQRGGTGASVAPPAPLLEGTYVVTCRYPNGATGSTRLRVTP